MVCSTATCSAPTTSEFNHSNVTTSTVQLSTTASGNQFQFRIKPSSGSTWTTSPESASTVVNISNLTGSTSYDYQVRRRCTNNVWSGWSATRTFTTGSGSSNTTCATAATITCGQTVTGTTSGAAQNVSDCGNTELNTAPGLWYRYTASQTGLVTATTCNSGTTFDTKIGVFSGSCSNLSCIGGNDDASCSFNDNRSTVQFSATSGQTYYIYVTGYEANSGTFQLTLTCTTATCSAPTTSEFNHSNVTTSTVQLSTTASGNQFQFRIKPSSGSTWTTSPESASTVVNISNLTGSTSYDYQVRRRCTNNVWSDWSATRTFTTGSGSSNATCAAAATITCGQTVTGTTSGAAQNVSDCGNTELNTAPGLWYRYTASQTGLVTATTCNSGTTFDTKIGVFSGSCSNLSCIGGNDDASCSFNGNPSTVQFSATSGQTYYIYVTGYEANSGTFQLTLTCTNATCSAPTTSEFNHSNVTTSTVQLSTTASGNQFQFRIKPSSGSTWTTSPESASTVVNISNLTGSTSYDYQVRRRCTNNVWSDWSATRTFTTGSGSSNATCAAAATITCGQTVTGTTSGAAQNVSDCGNTELNTAPGLWYRYTASQTGLVTATTCNSGTTFDTKIGVFSGSCSNLSCIGGNDDASCSFNGNPSTVQFSATSGQTYYIYVTGYEANSGTFQLTLTCTTATCSAPTTSEFNHSNVTTSSAQLSTTASGNQFQFRYMVSSGSTWSTTPESASTVANISNLTGSTSYDYQVRQRCTNNVWSDWSATRTFSTTTATCSAPTSLIIDDINATTYTVNWTAVSGATAYEIQQKEGSGNWNNIGGNPFGEGPIYVSGAPACTALQVRVRAICGSNNSPYSNEVSFTTTCPCSAPTTSEFNHSNVTTSSAQLSTTASGNQFQFRYKVSSGTTWTTSPESASTVANISNLIGSTSYDYQVRQRCTNNVWSDWSATRTFTTTGLSTIPWTRSITGSNHTIIIQTSLTATLDGTPLEPGDAIGFFFEHDGALHCSNYLVLSGQNQSVAVYGNDATAPNKNGFATGETFKVKVYQAATQQEFDAQVSFAPAGTVIPPLTITASNQYATNGISLLTNLNATSSSTFRITLTSGWNMISSNTLPADANLPAVFTDLTSVVEIVKDVEGNSYLPVLNINGIGNWEITKGYQVRSAADTVLTITGSRVDPAATPIPINSGWQIISYLRTQAAPINEQLAGIAGIVELVKDNLGAHVYIPGLINSIEDMQPGQGYQLKALSSGTLSYSPNQLWSDPSEVQSASNIQERTVPSHFEYDRIQKSCNNSTLVIRSEVASGMMEPGDEIGVFTTDGILCGAAVFEDRHFAVTVWGDDPTTPDIREGMLPGEIYQIRVWRPVQNVEINVRPSFVSGDQVYHNDDIEVPASLHLISAVKDLSIAVQPLSVFPNPTDGRFYAILPSGVEMLEILDSKGNLLQRILSPATELLPIETTGYPRGLLLVSAWDKQGRRWYARVVLR